MARPKIITKAVTVTLPQSLILRAKRKAKLDGRTLSNWLNKAIREELNLP